MLYFQGDNKIIEKMNRRQKLENKLEKRLDWAKKRKDKSNNIYNQFHEETKDLVGQPILIGHHSQKSSERTVERHNNLLRKSVENDKMAKYHNEKAEGLERMLNKTIFSDDVDAIEKLNLKLKGLEEKRTKIKEFNKKARKEKKEQVPSWNLQNIGANIRSVKLRIKRLTIKKKNK